VKAQRLRRDCKIQDEEGWTLLDFEEELKRFRPSLEIGNVEDAIGKEDLTDMTDLMVELLNEKRN
jgi:hypothetical protein